MDCSSNGWIEKVDAAIYAANLQQILAILLAL